MGQIVNADLYGFRAPEPWLRRLAETTPEHCLINGGGEIAPYDGLVMADYIKDGRVWLDYCAYPMYYYRLDGQIKRQGAGGFANFLFQAGYPLSHDFWAHRQGFVYPRSLVLYEEPPSFLLLNPYSSWAWHVYSSFGLKIGRGYYFYAFASDPWPEGTKIDPPGVTPDTYTRFVNEALAQLPPPPQPQPVPTPTPTPIPPPIDTPPAPMPLPIKLNLPTIFLGGAVLIALLALWRQEQWEK